MGGPETLADLEKEYCPPLDAALFSAIATDYDSTDPTQVQQLRETLDILKLSALEQEDLPFDPSGTSGSGGQCPFTSNATNEADGSRSGSGSVSQNDIRSRGTDISSLTSDLSLREKDWSEASTPTTPTSAYIVGSDGRVTLAGASLGDKTGYLVEMFPTVDRFTIEHSLKKSNGDVDRAMDVLLNLAFFDEQQQQPDDEGKVMVPKGIDGFEETAAPSKGRKGKSKKKNLNNSSLKKSATDPLPEASEPYGNSINKWDASQKDVDFIHSRTSAILKKETVASTYHANGASLPATIRSLAQTHAPPAPASKAHIRPVTETQISELTQEFPSIPAVTFAGLLHITRNSPSAANELAAALVTQPMAPSVSQLIQFTATPLKLDDEDEADKKSKKDKRRRAQNQTVDDFDRAQGSAGAHFVAGAEAFSKASMAYRRGRSDRLMGGAAAYYSVVGREHLERAKRDAAAASDALVDAQSTADMLDLHGVSVQDAVRIASDRVAEWWEGLGETKYIRRDGAVTYRIITGVGRHSHDGTSRLGPAVFRRLVSDGWRVEVGEGAFTVTGVARR